MDFYEKLKELKIYDIDKILKSFQNQKNVFVFVNLIKNSYENFEYFCKNLEIKTKIFEIFADEIKIKLYEINNFDKLKLTKNNEFNQGFFYILNPSSVFSPILLNPKENEKILDMCASPGLSLIHI